MTHRAFPIQGAGISIGLLLASVLAALADNNPLALLLLTAAVVLGVVTAFKVRTNRFESNLHAVSLETLANTAPALLWTTDAYNNTVYFNKSWLEFTGRTLEEELGYGWWNAIHDDERDQVFKDFVTYTEQHVPFSLEYRLQRHDGIYRWLRDSGVPRYDEAGNYVGYVGSCIDITDHKTLEQALKESEWFARATVDALSAHIAIIDENGAIVAVNKAWRDFASNNQPIRSNVFEGANYLEVCERATGPDSENARAFARGIRMILRGETNEYALEYPCHAPFEHRWFNARVTRFEDSGPVRVVISHENITKRKLLEQSTIEQNEIIETVNRVGQELSAQLNLNTLLQSITNAATEVTHAQIGVVFYNLDNNAEQPYDRYTTVTTGDADANRLADLRQTALFKTILERDGVFWSDNIQQDKRLLEQMGQQATEIPVLSLLAVSIRSRKGEVLGGLFLGHGRSAMFGKRHEQLALGLASQASIALDNARLYEETRRQAKQYEVTLASIGDAVIATDQHGNVTFINAVASRMTAWNEDEALGQPLERVFHIVDEENHVPSESPFSKVMRTGAIVGLANHTLLIARDGQTTPIDDSGAPIRNDSGEITGVVLVFRDVTERKHAEERLRFLVDVNKALTSSLDYSATLQSVTELAVPQLADWAILNVIDSDNEIRILAEKHVDPEAQVTLDQIRQLYPNHRGNIYRQVIETQQPLLLPEVDSTDISTTAIDSEHARLLSKLALKSHLCVPLLSGRGCIGTLTLATRAEGRTLTEADLMLAVEIAHRVSLAIENTRLFGTERKARQEAELATARVSLLQSITAALSEAVTPSQVAAVIVERTLHSLGGQVVTVSLVTPDGECLDVTALDSPDNGGVVTQAHKAGDEDTPLHSVVHTGLPIWIESENEYRLRFPHAPVTAHLPVLASASLPLMANGHIIGGIGISFAGEHAFTTEDKSFLMSLAQQCAQAVQRAQLFADEHAARKEAEHANALKLKFLAMISHELRTPLTSIKGFANTLLADDVQFSDSDQQFFISIIDEEADKLAELVDQLMDLSRMQAGTLGIQPQPQPLARVVERATAQLATLTLNHQLSVNVPNGMPSVMVDAQRIAQVLVNLVGNAVKYAPSGSEIAIRASRVGDMVQVNVSDHGPGIPSEAHSYVFEAFRQVDGNSMWPKKGAGLGLAICKGLIEAHGGNVWIDTDVTSGTTISFTLPLAQQLLATHNNPVVA
jgi:PAS domain S-box-containing protein